jgi:molybdate transport system ATP-binding protein
MSNTLLELAGVSLRINSRLVFRNTNWTFGRNQNWALVGSNGSGKTLLARSIAGELPVARGEIRFGFRAPSNSIPEDLIALVSFEQQKALVGDSPPAVRWFSVEQDEAPRVKQFLSQDSVEEVNPFEVRIRTAKSARRFARLQRRILALLEINSLLNRPLPSLSNGEMRKILLARALLTRPRLLILDDAFAGLDSQFRRHLKSILEKLMAQDAIHLLLISPGLDDLPRGITHMLFVHNCRVIAHGPWRTVMRDPRFCKIIGPVKTASRPRALSLFKIRPRQRQQSLVEMENVSVKYDHRVILSGINWTIRRGESWALIGPNGSGKSTLLSLISGDNPQAYANSIRLFGRMRGSGESVWELKRRIGWISSELHLHFPESQTCLETVISGFHETIGCRNTASSPRRKIARQLLRQLGILELSKASFGSISAGLQRTVLLARALVKSPDLLLLDEPCQGLDRLHRDAFLKILESILGCSEATMVYVTHVREEVPKGIHRILQLKDGRIVRAGLISKNRKSIL